MGKVWQQYKASVLLLGGLIIGGIAGAVFGEKATVVQPLGDLFLNLMFVMLVPLVFFSISSAIANMNGMKRLGKIMGSTFFIFFATALVAAVVGYIGVVLYNPIKGIDVDSVKALMGTPEASSTADMGLLERIVNTLTVPDFHLLLSKSNMLQLIVFSILVGVSTSLANEAGKPVAKLLASGNAVMMKMVSVIMYYAPIGLGCYFASVIGTLGSKILGGYARSMILYVVIAVIYYLLFFSMYAFIAGGKAGLKIYWRNIAPPSITAIATCSSAASIPVNLEYAKKMGITPDIAETVIPLGANTHKDGSVIGCVIKIAFLFGIFGKEMTTPSAMVTVILGAFLVGAVMGAIPGGGMIAEMLIVNIFGFPLEAVPVIVIISTIIDMPATLLNSSGNLASGMLVTRIVEGKNWLKDFLTDTPA
ncbi:sodium:proton antiporter [Carnobacterium maltaromaticum]|uniref:dicarboxylate/amino acid:cation symporter n=1 Tax=Carnobacterium maltaromaticum TaxID=2751 RepID=UPI000C760C9C|nr:dicarboxylate/amino acid:cation symporter [Carnobacterium maltaromaticum]PLS32376.1 sodium:proton antiporter [Carnobacterium maltaromaticum]PLS35900.1 sodium:proton antiporter [Carnobacterium maltaromaticum]PLS36350.1 sodium:proton antiporter [Carnobacterium maltaromaticum]PLS41469.1 sodium:proton antiporter [Carnobacterium maltaromaticum]PLS43043.1 sodium:proton antiporter [Carnobacterium maltaromaticum]